LPSNDTLLAQALTAKHTSINQRCSQTSVRGGAKFSLSYIPCSLLPTFPIFPLPLPFSGSYTLNPGTEGMEERCKLHHWVLAELSRQTISPLPTAALNSFRNIISNTAKRTCKYAEMINKRKHVVLHRIMGQMLVSFQNPHPYWLRHCN